MQTRSSDENSVRPSVRPSHACIVTKRKKDLSRFLNRTKDNLASFTEKKNGWWGTTPSTWNFGSTGPRWSKIADFEQIIARSASAVTPSEKSSINAISIKKCTYRLKKICYKVSFCENCQRQSCKAFIGLTNRAKMIGGGDPLYLKFWIKVTALVRNRRFSIYFRS